MFFDEWLNENENENINLHESEKLKYKGSFTPHNMDVNWTHFDVFFDKTYSKWRFHFIFVLTLLIIISQYYPIIFIIVSFEIIIHISWWISDHELLTDNYFYDYALYMSQIKGGDSRLNMYIFAYYDRLGYIIYGLDDIGDNYCNELFKYNNYLNINLEAEKFSKLTISSKAIKTITTKKSLKNKSIIINYEKRFYFLYKEININKFNMLNKNIKQLKKTDINKKLNFYYFFNNDKSYNWINFKNILKEKI